MEEGREAHWEVVQRILFLYAKLNPGQGYVQGMNEIIGPIYYVLASDPNIEYRRECSERPLCRLVALIANQLSLPLRLC